MFGGLALIYYFSQSMKQLLFALLVPLSLAAAATPLPPKAPEVPAELPPEIQTLQPGVKLTMLAEHPDLVTPTGIDVDDQGQIWSISCHTHFRPEGYDGPQFDEVVVFDASGKNRRVFYNKTFSTMHVECGRDGWIYLAQRNRILRVKDTDGDGVGDKEETLAALDTLADYPHNGLSGMAWDPDGGLVFSLGENFGKDWTLTAKDGSKVSGRGEGGVFRCTAEGTQMRRIAKGFWNPFGILVRSDGEIFAADNDPGSRPPCRLLSIVEGADYGFQWVYGSAPVHPFVAWNGELRGTLGMIHPSGEGPCAVVEIGGGVMIPSWSNHCIDYFPLHRKGAGYTSERIELVRGGEFFRPTCMAAGPDGAFYFNDWVFSSYPIHKRGRLWKLEIDKSKATWMKPSADPLNEDARLAKGLRDGSAELTTDQLLKLAQGTDANLSDAALTALARDSASWTPESLKKMPTMDRVWAFVALRRANLNDEKWVRAMLPDRDPEMRFECLRWIADAVLTRFSGDVEKMLADPTLDFRLFEAALATWNTLRGDPGAGVTNPEVLVERILNPSLPAKLKGYALRLAPATHKQLSIAVLRDLFAAHDPVLSLEVVRSLAARNADDARTVLAEIAADASQPSSLRAEAISGMASSLQPEHHALLLKLAANDEATIRHESLRALRLSPLDDAAKESLKAVAKTYADSQSLVTAALDFAAINVGRPPLADTVGWLKRLDTAPGKPDTEAGRRIFFHSKVALCASCHRHSGRGNVVGPDLSLISRQGDREAILRSILEPNREVAPQFFPTQLKLKDGSDFTGILLRSSSTEVFRDLTGKERTFQKTDIIQRTELTTSPMPPGLPSMLTDDELRDLLAFLTGR